MSLHVSRFREYSLGGQYRKILKRPNHLTWEKIRYTDPNADIIQPDEDALLGMEAPKHEETGEKLAIRLEFDLDSASYATMALREVLKSETSNVNQRALTEAMMAKEQPKEEAASTGMAVDACEPKSVADTTVAGTAAAGIATDVEVVEQSAKEEPSV